MRELKFRYYNVASKSMHPNIYYAIDMDGNFLMSMPLPEGKYPETDRRFTITELHKGDAVMQFTGLKDKNGVEIYEGDRFQYLTKSGFRKQHVVFHDGTFGCLVARADLNDLFIPLSTFISRHGIEVIGNIYENKELLNAS